MPLSPHTATGWVGWILRTAVGAVGRVDARRDVPEGGPAVDLRDLGLREPPRGEQLRDDAAVVLHAVVQGLGPEPGQRVRVPGVEHDALGVAHVDMPYTPEKLWKVIHQQ